MTGSATRILLGVVLGCLLGVATTGVYYEVMTQKTPNEKEMRVSDGFEIESYQSVKRGLDAEVLYVVRDKETGQKYLMTYKGGITKLED